MSISKPQNKCTTRLFDKERGLTYQYTKIRLSKEAFGLKKSIQSDKHFQKMA